MMSAREKVLHHVFGKLGYTLEGNILDIVLSTAQHKLIKAPAGGTKTTLAQLIIANEKLDFLLNKLKDKNAPQYLDSSEILCLVYNTHNVPDVLAVHKRMYNAFEAFGLFSKSLMNPRFMVSDMTASTVHAHAKALILKYKGLLKLRDIKLGNTAYLNSIMKNSFESVFGEKVRMSDKVKSLYDLYTNLLLFQEDTHKDRYLFLTEMSAEDYPLYKKVFDGYDNVKLLTKNQEFSDWIKAAISLHKKFPDQLVAEKTKYRYIVMDEVQDFTPLMLEYAKCLLHDKAKTIVIGDPDQTIYQFNGTDHTVFDSIPAQTGLDFTKFFMNTNRRSRERTMSFPRALLAHMTDRDDFEIKTVKQGGEFKVLQYETTTEETATVLNDYDTSYYNSNAFLFRSGSESIPFTRTLYLQGRPYSMYNAMSFHEHDFYKDFLETVKKVFVYQDRTTWSSLYRILPISKKALEEFLKIDTNGEPTAFPEVLKWSKIDWMQIKKTINPRDSWIWQMIFALGLADNMSNASARDVVEVLIEMYRKNYYNYLERDPFYLEDIINMIRQDFDTDNNLRWVVTEIESKIHKLVTFKQLSSINVSTIHATKGLEFDRCYLMSMHKDDRAFNIQFELRLFYVGATRQRDSLVLSVDKTNSHPFASHEYTLTQSVDLENRFDIKPTTNFDTLFSGNDNPNVRRLFN